MRRVSLFVAAVVAVAALAGCPAGAPDPYVPADAPSAATTVEPTPPEVALVPPEAPDNAGDGGRPGLTICRDGTTSTATGRGACSHHGGVKTRGGGDG